MPDRDEPHLEKPAGSRVWRTYVWVTDAATGARKRRYVTTGCRNRKAARRRALEIESEAQDPHLAVAKRTTLEEVLGLWLDAIESEVKAGNNAQATHDYYVAKIAAVLKVFGQDFRIGQFSHAGPADGYVRARRDAGAGQHTIKKELGVLRGALELARRLKLWTGVVEDVLPYKFASGYEPRERVVPPLELQKLFPLLDQDNAARAAWMVATSGEWGASTRAERADVADGAVFVRGTKNEARERTVPIVAAWQRSLMRYAVDNGQGTGALLFRTSTRNAFYQDLKRVCAKLELQPATANDLRRTCATWLLADGASFDDVAKVMGHVDTRMLHKVYGRIGAEELRSRLQAQLGLSSTAVAEQAGKAGTDGAGGKSGSSNPAESGNDGVADGTRTRNTWSHSPVWLWPIGRKNSGMGRGAGRRRSRAVAGRAT